VTIGALPRLDGGSLGFTIGIRAHLEFDNRLLDWVNDQVGGDRLVSRLAAGQLDTALLSAIGAPPPLTLPGGPTLTVELCPDRAVEVHDDAWAAVPLRWKLGAAVDARDGGPPIRPPRRGGFAFPPPGDAALTLDLDLDALNALLFELWRSGLLDARLTEAGLDRRFNTDPTVTELLSVRISAPRLALPPVLSPHGAGLRLSADARVRIADGATQTIGRVWGGLDFTFAATELAPVSVDLGELALSCERTPTLLVPCYADLVAAIGGRGADFHGELTQTFAGLLADIFVDRRLSESGLPADLVIRRAAPSLHATAANASLHLELDATLVTRP
jgi:hypothetical protein